VLSSLLNPETDFNLLYKFSSPSRLFPLDNVLLRLQTCGSRTPSLPPLQPLCMQHLVSCNIFWLQILHRFFSLILPHFRWSASRIFVWQRFHVFKADYFQNLLCARAAFCVRGRKCKSESQNQWTMVRHTSLSTVCLSAGLTVCLSVQLFRVHCMSVSWQLHSQCAAALLILFQLCACECLVSLMGTFDFHFSYCNYSLYTQIHTHTHKLKDFAVGKILITAPLWANGYSLSLFVVVCIY